MSKQALSDLSSGEMSLSSFRPILNQKQNNFIVFLLQIISESTKANFSQHECDPGMNLTPGGKLSP
jgi:hypothetical protein